MKKPISLNIIVNWNFFDSKGMSGGDRIFIEFSRRWVEFGWQINIFTNESGFKMCKAYNLGGVRFFIWSSERFNRLGIYLAGIIRILISIKEALKVKFSSDYRNFVYSSSDFLPDAIPAFLMKLKNSKVKWIAAFFLFAPKPWQKDSPYKGKALFKGLVYWLFQFPSYWLIKKYADIVFVTSEPDVKRFITKKRGKEKIVVIRGGVDIRPSEEYFRSGKVISPKKRKYDACFIGRFHPQKGVFGIIDIWKFVCQKNPRAKLVMIGEGPLEKEVKRKIKKMGLGKNIKLVGFKDGKEKYEIFKQSKIVVHPAIYDSGGMAACEAMAWGLPGVSFDLEALRTYYPKGMIKTPCYDLEKFAENIVSLLSDEDLYQRISEEAVNWARKWDWGKKAKVILDKIEKSND